VADTTLEEASRCPLCHTPGRLEKTEPQRDGSRIHFFVCANINRCRWADGAPWIVQVRRDGTVVQAQKHQKKFPAIPDRTEEVRRRVDEDIRRSLGN